MISLRAERPRPADPQTARKAVSDATRPDRRASRPGQERPSASGSVHVARNGEIFRIRPLLPCDRDRLREGFERASRQTRLQRFFRHRNGLGEQELTYLTEVDQESHVALCAGRVDDRHATGAAVARFIRDKADSTRAEFAITVLDEFQGLGLGTAIMSRLIEEARQRGVTRLWGHVLNDNHGALRWMESLGGDAVFLGDVFLVSFDVANSDGRLSQRARSPL